MRNLTRLAMCAAIVVAAANIASAQTAPPMPGPEIPADRAPLERKVTVVDVAALPSDAQRKVNAATLQMTDQDVQVMRAQIAAMPEATTALMARGLQPAQVIAVDESDDGSVILITRTAI